MAVYPWYDSVETTSVEQGDFVFDFDVAVVATTIGDRLDARVETYDAIIITQSCDIPKVDHLILCPVFDPTEAAKLHPHFGNPGGLEELRKGRYFAFHLLNRCEIDDFKRSYMIVQFDHPIVVPKRHVEAHYGEHPKHLRLLPPYREHLAQSFARFFMRVGLPIDIPPFK